MSFPTQVARRISTIAVTACLLFSGLDHAHCALIVNEYDRESHDRFSNSSSFIGSSYDWSGVGRNTSGQWATLISDRHFVTATHYAPANNSVVRFYATNDPNGAYAEQTVITKQSVDGSDLSVGELTAPVYFGSEFDINYYPLLSLPNTNDFIGESLYVVGQSTDAQPANMRLGRNEVTGVIPSFANSALSGSGDIFYYSFDAGENGVGADEARVSGGDSGAPSFVAIDGQLTVAGVHWFTYGSSAGSSGSGDTLISSYVNEITLITALSAVSSVPEPTMALPLLLLASAIACRRKRSRSGVRSPLC